MSLRPRFISEVPDKAHRVAQAAFPKGDIFLGMRNELGELYAGQLFSDLLPECEQPAETLERLSLITGQNRRERSERERLLETIAADGQQPNPAAK